MKNIFKTVKEWAVTLKENHSEESEKKRKENLDILCKTRLQIIEFNGKLYISYQGEPVVRVDSLKDEATKILTQSRKDYLDWREKFIKS